jgi:hypothetical protein
MTANGKEETFETFVPITSNNSASVLDTISLAINVKRFGLSVLKRHCCAAEAIFYCPTMNSHRPKFQVTS